MRFDLYGRFQIEVSWEADSWVAYRIAAGTRARIHHLAIPAEIRTAGEMARYLDDLYHEVARPGQSVAVVDD